MNYQDGFMIWEDSGIKKEGSSLKKYDADYIMDCEGKIRQSYFLENCIQREDFNRLLYDIASSITENQDNSITWEG